MTRTDDLIVALDAARAAGPAIMAEFRAEPEVSYKAPDQPVTAADLEADAILADRLRSARPDYGWLSEETVDRPDRLGRDRVWVVDPVDGTRSFIAGYREFAVSVGLVEGGEPVMGVVYNPARDEVFWAVRGSGAFRARHWTGDGEAALGDGERLKLEPVPEGRRVSLLASRTEIARAEFAAFAADWHLRPLGSTAYKLARLACGTGDAYLSRGPKSEWDVAAGALLVTEAGGRVTDLRGEPLRFNRRDPEVHGLLAATPALHAVLLEAARELPAPRLDGRAGSRDDG
jgi:myo-inositol-1(or 4)-monophosphatase